MNIGIYQIKNIKTGVAYFGRTVDWAARKRRHLSDLRGNRHKNPRLQHSWNTRNESDFTFDLVWTCEKESLEELESFVLDFCFDSGRLYNAHKNSVGGFLGQKHSDETKRKWSEGRKGKKLSDVAKARQSASRVGSDAWKRHQEWMRTPEAIAGRCSKAAAPDVRAKAVATRAANGFKPFSEETRQAQRDAAKARVFAALDWAVATGATRDAALTKFQCSWDGLKKYQPAWEEINGPLTLPKRASGEKSGKFKHGMSAEKRRKKTAEEIARVNERRSKQMSGANNPMFGRKHTEEAKRIQAEAARMQAIKAKG